MEFSDDTIIFIKVSNGSNKEVSSKGVILQHFCPQTEITNFRNLVKQLALQCSLLELFEAVAFQLFS